MAQALISCPLCSSASFSSINALCVSLVNISSKWLLCMVCQEELHGLDKLTIHLLSHLTQNPDFGKLFLNDSGSSNSDSITEPLNLAKVCRPINKSKEDDCNTYFSSKDFSNMELDKQSIKIDDEVMIIFKSNENYLQNKQNTGCDLSPSVKTSFKSSHTTLTPDFDGKLERPTTHEEPYSFNRTETISNENSIDPPSTYQYQSNTFLLKDRSTFSCTVSSNMCSEHNSQLDRDMSSLNKERSTKNDDNCTNIVVDNEKSEVFDLKKKAGIKSSFLSPKGERVLGFRCDVCSLVFPDEHILSLHRQLIHVELNDDPAKTNRFKCHLCSKSFVMRGSLMVHIRVAHFGGAVVARLIETKQLENNAVSPDSAQFVCSICNKGFRKEQQLIQHEKLHDGKQCDVCLKTFTTKYFLRKHKRLHTGEMPYSCSICNKSFTFQQSYHKHLLYHSDDKPYSCPECGRAFKELSTLHNHQRIHTGEKPFSCETCDILMSVLF